MPHAPGTGVADRAAGEPADAAPDDVVARASALLARPGLVVLTGAPGAGRSTALRDLAAAFRGPVFAGGGLSMLQDVPALALSRAVRVRLPAHDTALLAEAVRSRVRSGLLVVDDLQWADPATVAAVAALAAHTRVAVALRTPHRLPAESVAALRAASAGWLAVPPLSVSAATDLARRVAPALGDAALAEVVRRAGGVPLAVTALARHAAAGRPAAADRGAEVTGALPVVVPATPEVDQVAYAVAEALADLTRPARTAMAALGLLGRPACPTVLGAGVAELREAGLVITVSAPAGAPSEPGASAPIEGNPDSGAAGAPAPPGPGPAVPADGSLDPGRSTGDTDPALSSGRSPLTDGESPDSGGSAEVIAPAGQSLALPDDGRSDPAGVNAAGVPAVVPTDISADLDRSSRAATVSTVAGAGAVVTADSLRDSQPIPPAIGVAGAGDRRPDDGGSAGSAAPVSEPAVPDLVAPTERSPGNGTAADAVAPEVEGELVAPASPYVAEVAAGMLDPASRVALHRRLAELTPDREAARHLAAAGDDAGAAARALAAVARAGTAGERAELLLLACDLPGVRPTDATRTAAAAAALAAGRPRDAVRVLASGGPVGVDAAVLRAEALLQIGDLAGARAAAAPVPDDAPASVRAARDRVLLLARLATDPAGALDVAAGHGATPEHAGLRAAVAAVRAAGRVPGWEYGLASAAEAAAAAGDLLSTRWSAWLLVETLAADGRLAEAATTAQRAAAACASDLAYSWQARFLAAALWCEALRGDPAGTPADDVVRRAADLNDRTVPTLARAYAVAAASLVEADGGLLAPARARLAAAAPAPAAAALLDWVGREAAWLDGQPDRAAAPDGTAAPPLVDGLRRITARWAAYDAGVVDEPDPAELDATDRASAGLPAVRETLAAWSGTGGFDLAAEAWHDLVVREEVRCLLAAGLHETDPERAVAALLAAESLAESAGLVVLLGRARRALRRHAVRRETRGPRAGSDLTDRERDVLRLVARGEPSRRVAGQLGISAETVETHIRAGMRKLGARTRTAAAAMALEQLR
ncbi:regulatory protein, luxR family [Asanoa hainanensis]|uniref:Regulatory protein, luxR family n=1 Tax=Asanoa hainanensis TaxID=560556 RepID=A0A239G7D0_9ACTN|nr:LuxR C-terminal-related transcriptional regulator [Asanoa hainanensis]SNS63944.1 regulatory protein, luxR family [Asanoa hainanensis]